MATNALNLPPGFVLDGQEQQKSNLPPGFVLDNKQTRPDLLYSMAGVTPDELRSEGRHGLAAIQEAGRDMITIPAKFFNMLLLNNPKSLVEKMGFEYPDTVKVAEGQSNSVLKLGGDVAGLAGLFQTGGNVMGAAPAGLGGQMAAGAAMGAAYAPEDFTDLGQRAMQGAFGAAVPLAIKGTVAAGGAIGVGIKGAKNIISKASADFVNMKVVPKAHGFYQKSVDKFTPQIQRFAKKQGVSDGAIQTIKKVGTKKADQVRNLYGDSTDAIFQKVQGGIESFKFNADTMYKKAVTSFKGNSIESSGFYQATQKGLRKKGWIDLKGNPTTRYKSGLDPVADRLTDMYLDMQNATTSSGKRITGKVISKEDFFTYRDALGNMIKEKPSDQLVMQARNSLYNAAEKSGMTGLKAARNMENKYYMAKKKFLNPQGQLKAFGQEKGLDKFHKASQEQIRQLREVEKFTGVKFVDDLDIMTAAREMDKLKSYDVKKFATDLNQAVDKKWTKHIKKEYNDLLGADMTESIFKDIVSHRTAVKAKKIGIGVGIAGGSLAIGGKPLIRKIIGD